MFTMGNSLTLKLQNWLDPRFFFFQVPKNFAMFDGSNPSRSLCLSDLWVRPAHCPCFAMARWAGALGLRSRRPPCCGEAAWGLVGTMKHWKSGDSMGISWWFGHSCHPFSWDFHGIFPFRFFWISNHMMVS